MISVKNLSASFANKNIFKNISFEINKGDFICLCGKNGAGKSTLLSLLDGIKPSGISLSGEILVEGKNVFNYKRKNLATKISYLSQKENPCWDFSVNEFLQTAFYANENVFTQIQQKKLVNEALEKVGMKDFFYKKIFTLSGGEFQKIRIARVLLTNSDVIILDEPLENLDISFEKQFLHFIKKLAITENKTVIFSIHNINLAVSFCEKFFMICDKKVLTGNKAELFTSEVLAQVYNAPCKVYFDNEIKEVQVLFKFWCENCNFSSIICI